MYSRYTHYLSTWKKFHANLAHLRAIWSAHKASRESETKPTSNQQTPIYSQLSIKQKQMLFFVSQKGIDSPASNIQVSDQPLKQSGTGIWLRKSNLQHLEMSSLDCTPLFCLFTEIALCSHLKITPHDHCYCLLSNENSLLTNTEIQICILLLSCREVLKKMLLGPL